MVQRLLLVSLGGLVLGCAARATQPEPRFVVVGEATACTQERSKRWDCPVGVAPGIDVLLDATYTVWTFRVVRPPEKQSPTIQDFERHRCETVLRERDRVTAIGHPEVVQVCADLEARWLAPLRAQPAYAWWLQRVQNLERDNPTGDRVAEWSNACRMLRDTLPASEPPPAHVRPYLDRCDVIARRNEEDAARLAERRQREAEATATATFAALEARIARPPIDGDRVVDIQAACRELAAYTSDPARAGRVKQLEPLCRTAAARATALVDEARRAYGALAARQPCEAHAATRSLGPLGPELRRPWQDACAAQLRGLLARAGAGRVWTAAYGYAVAAAAGVSLGDRPQTVPALPIVQDRVLVLEGSPACAGREGLPWLAGTSARSGAPLRCAPADRAIATFTYDLEVHTQTVQVTKRVGSERTVCDPKTGLCTQQTGRGADVERDEPIDHLRGAGGEVRVALATGLVLRAGYRIEAHRNRVDDQEALPAMKRALDSLFPAERDAAAKALARATTADERLEQACRLLAVGGGDEAARRVVAEAFPKVTPASR